MYNEYLITDLQNKLNDETKQLLEKIKFDKDKSKIYLNKINLINKIMINLESYLNFKEEPEKEEKPKKISNKNFDLRDLKK